MWLREHAYPPFSADCGPVPLRKTFMQIRTICMAHRVLRLANVSYCTLSSSADLRTAASGTALRRPSMKASPVLLRPRRSTRLEREHPKMSAPSGTMGA